MVLDEVKDKYKDYARFFQEYDRPECWTSQPIATKEKNLDPFKKVNWKTVYDNHEKDSFYFKEVDGELVWAFFMIESKSNRGIKDIAGDVIGRIQPGDLQITRFAYKDDYLDELILEINKQREEITDFFTTSRDLWFTNVNMELENDKELLNKIGGNHLSSKITAVGSEVRGIWYVGQKEQPGYSQYEDLTIKKMNFESLTDDECKELVKEIVDYDDALNPWSYDGINGNYGGPEKTWYTIEIVPIRPGSDTDYKILDKSSMIVLSPGPGEPKDYPLTTKIYKSYKGKKKILGICLGFQQIIFSEGGKIVQQNHILHGYQSRIKVISKNSIFNKQKS